MDATDIWRAANMMIELHELDAGIHAALRADALLDQGDTEDSNVWKRIVKAIGELQSEIALPGAQIN